MVTQRMSVLFVIHSVMARQFKSPVINDGTPPILTRQMSDFLKISDTLPHSTRLIGWIH